MKNINITKLMVLVLGCSTNFGLQAMQSGGSSSSSSSDIFGQFYAVIDSDKTDDLKELIAAGLDVNTQESISYATPLHYAVWGGHAVCVQLLIKAKANIDSAGTYGRTPLRWAAFRAAEQLECYIIRLHDLKICIKLLLAAGAEPALCQGQDVNHTRAQAIVDECRRELSQDTDVRRAAIVDRMRSVPELNDFPPGLLPLIASFSSLEN